MIVYQYCIALLLTFFHLNRGSMHSISTTMNYNILERGLNKLVIVRFLVLLETS
jgi:hypothetical protein